MRREVARPAEQPLVERDELLGTHRRVDRCRWRGGFAVVVALVGVALLSLVVDLVEGSHRVALERLDVLCRDNTFLDEPLAEDQPGRWMRLDRGVERGLGERGLVALVMSVPPIADEVDEKVLLELRAVGDAEPGDG